MQTRWDIGEPEAPTINSETEQLKSELLTLNMGLNIQRLTEFSELKFGLTLKSWLCHSTSWLSPPLYGEAC